MLCILIKLEALKYEMGAFQIRTKINADECMKNTCWGVFARDELPQILLNGGYQIILSIPIIKINEDSIG